MHVGRIQTLYATCLDMLEILTLWLALNPKKSLYYRARPTRRLQELDKSLLHQNLKPGVIELDDHRFFL